MSFTSQQIDKAIVAACDVIGVPKLKAKQREAIGEFVQGLRLHERKLANVWLWHACDFTQLLTTEVEQVGVDWRNGF